MNILLIGGQSIPGIGGVETYMLNLGRSLVAMGHKVTIICSDREAKFTTIDGIEIVHKVCPKSNIIALPLLFFKSLHHIIQNRRNIDVVNLQSIIFAFIPGWTALMCGSKTCYTIHSLAEDSPKYNRLLKCIIKVITFISIHLCRRNILTISNSKADEIKHRYGKVCSVIPCGVSPAKEEYTTDILDKYGIIKGKYYLTIGRIDPIKNLDILVQAFIEHNNPVSQLVIAGDYSNEYGVRLLQLSKNHKNIIFVGRVIGEDKTCLLKNCFINCLVSSSEGMPISILEAMIYGKISIVSDIPAIREIVHDNWALWCKAGDVNSLTQQMHLAEIGDNNIFDLGPQIAQHTIENHTWENIAAKYITFLSHI